MTYPLTGVLITVAGFTTARVVLAVLVLGCGLLARRLWPSDLVEVVAHTHDETTDPDHLSDANGRVHTHRIVTDGEHARWRRATGAVR